MKWKDLKNSIPKIFGQVRIRGGAANNRPLSPLPAFTGTS
ncbi:hypothetical protein HMPREF9374_2037 [Desmospora sp. 8437]|nr:hypothetical protein HMPREF9374_2037 [Desmospora sp. 8437]